MIYKAWSSIEEVPYCLSRSSIKFQGDTGQKIANFDPNRAFWTVTAVWIHQRVWNDAQSLDVAQKSCPVVFRRHPSNLKVTWTKKFNDLNPILNEITRLVTAIKSLRFVLLCQFCLLKPTLNTNHIWLCGWADANLLPLPLGHYVKYHQKDKIYVTYWHISSLGLLHQACGVPHTLKKIYNFQTHCTE